MFDNRVFRNDTLNSKASRCARICVFWRLSAVAGAPENAEIFAPGTYGLAVLVGHDSRDLVQMS